MKCYLGISNFLEEISSLSLSIVFLYFFALITEEGFLISPCYSLDLCIQMGISFFSSLLLASLLFSAICKASSDSHLASLHFYFLGMVLIAVSCTMLQTSICTSSGTLSVRSSPLSRFLTSTIIIRDLIWVIPECSSGFPHFLQFKSGFGNKDFMI